MKEPIEEHDYRLFAELAPSMLWRAGPDHTFTWFNRAWRESTGFSDVSASLDEWEEFIHPTDFEQLKDVLSISFLSKTSFRLQHRIKRRDGAFHWVQSIGRPYYRDGDFMGFLGCSMDIDDYRSAKRSLAAARAECDFLLREVHHRVKNNMQALMALVRFMKKAADPSGKALLDLLNMRLVCMSIVQNFIHSAEEVGKVSVRGLISSMIEQLEVADVGILFRLEGRSGDVVLSGKLAAYLGLAVAEAAAVLSQCGAASVVVEIENGFDAGISIRGSATESEISQSVLGLRLIRQYARGASAVFSSARAAEDAIFRLRVRSPENAASAG